MSNNNADEKASSGEEDSEPESDVELDMEGMSHMYNHKDVDKNVFCLQLNKTLFLAKASLKQTQWTAAK